MDAHNLNFATKSPHMWDFQPQILFLEDFFGMLKFRGQSPPPPYSPPPLHVRCSVSAKFH